LKQDAPEGCPVVVFSSLLPAGAGRPDACARPDPGPSRAGPGL